MGRTTEKLKERQQSKGHAHKQQGQLDDASRHLLFNPCVRQQQLLYMLDSQIV